MIYKKLYQKHKLFVGLIASNFSASHPKIGAIPHLKTLIVQPLPTYQLKLVCNLRQNKTLRPIAYPTWALYKKPSHVIILSDRKLDSYFEEGALPYVNSSKTAKTNAAKGVQSAGYGSGCLGHGKPG
jgi:hypothetical protein